MYGALEQICELRYPFCHLRSNQVARTRSLDQLLNPEAIIPPRPTISNLQWISGTQYITPSDMDLISEPLDSIVPIDNLTESSWWTRSPSLEAND